MERTLEFIPLGSTDLRVTPLGIGTWAWGDRLYWGYGNGYNDSDLQAAFRVCVEAGVNFFDTAEIYGQGQSEKFLGQFLRESNARVVVASKCFPLPWRFGKYSLRRALRGSLSRLGLKHIDLYQMHWPLPPVPIETWMSAMADAVEEGLIRAVGVSNYNREQMGRAQDALAKRGLRLASNQVHYSLLYREPERNGVLNACHTSGVTLIAYSPLESGVLTGKYTPTNPPPIARRSRFSAARLARIQSLIGLLKEIGQAHEGKTPSQVALNWAMCKNTLPIPGVKNARQAQDNVGALGWQLTGDEIATLDKASENL